MFVVNSRLGLSCAAGQRPHCSCSRRPAILIPRLRMHFAEFLNGGFPAHLGILSLPTCVGFRYGRGNLARGFSWRVSRGLRLPHEGSPPLRARFPSHARRAPPVARPASPPRRPRASAIPRGAGMFASCPFAVAHRLGLGPGFPRDDERCPGDLGLSVGRIPAALLATHTGILAPASSTCPRGHASPAAGRSPTGRIAAPPRLRLRA